MKRCFVITAYCNNEEKEQSLLDTINRIKEYDYDILVYSHYPVNEEIQKLCKYSLFDYSNPIFSHKEGVRSIISWKKINNYKLNCLIDDYGFAAVQQIKRALIFLYSVGYREAIIINYDTKFSQDFLLETQDNMSNADAVFLEYGEGVYLGFFAIKIEKFINEINQINKEDYLQYFDLMAEGYFAKLFNRNIKSIKQVDWENTGEVWTDVIYVGGLFDRGNDKCNLFVGLEKFEHGDNDQLSILCYSITTNFTLSIHYDNVQVYLTNIEQTQKFYSNLPIKFSELDYKKLRIYIDDNEVYTEHLKSIEFSSIDIIT